MTCVAGVCNCDPATLRWDNTYVGGGGLLLGRCRLQTGQGQADTCAGGCCSNLLNRAVNYGSSSAICTCPRTAFLNFETGSCENPGNDRMLNRHCDSSLQCPQQFTACMFIDGDTTIHQKCTLLPTVYFYNGAFLIKGDHGDPCNLYNPCNEWKNLKCSNYYGNGTVTGTCICLDKYFYYNGTMCVRGVRYGEVCTSAAQCVPTSNMVCAVPYAGAGNTVCTCAANFYYDLYQETCIALKRYNEFCRDNSECIDAYATATSPNSGFCGFIAGGAVSVCRCSFDYYAISPTSAVTNDCILKITKDNICDNTLTYPSCESNMICASACVGANCQCDCDYISFYHPTNNNCLNKGYVGDSCDSTLATPGIQCWSGTCTAGNLCT